MNKKKYSLLRCDVIVMYKFTGVSEEGTASVVRLKVLAKEAERSARPLDMNTSPSESCPTCTRAVNLIR